MDYKVSYRKKDKKVQCIINYKINDVWKQKASQKYTTQKEYKEWIKKTLKELKSKAELETVEEYKDCTLGELEDIFIEHQKLYKEPSTIISYKTAFNLLATLKDRSVASIKKHDIQTVVNKTISTGIKTSTLKVYLININIFFSYVKDNLGLISKLPNKGIEIPNDKSNSKKNALNNKEIENLLTDSKDDEHFIVYYLALNTGMRFGEILGLTWSDINFKDKIININKQWKKLLEDKEGFGNLKSKNSTRVIPISQNTIQFLKRYKANNPTDIFNRVACFKYSSLRKINFKLRSAFNVSMHELRHTYATKLVASNVDFKTVAKILGHDVEQTLRTYSHVTDDMMKNASQTIENIF